MSQAPIASQGTELPLAIAEIRVQIAQLRDQLGVALRTHAQLLADAHNVAVGDVVVSDGAEWRVTRLSLAITARPHLQGVKRGKHGKFGSAERNIGIDWQHKASSA